MLRPHRRVRDDAHGQILVLFVISLVVMMSMSALLFDAAQALVLKRQLQNAGDAAALAAANVIQSGTPRGCSATAGPPPGAPKASIVSAAQAAVTAALPGFDTSKITVTCPDGWSDYAVQVNLGGKSPSFFGGIIGLNGFGVGATSQAVNGQTTIFKYSVVTLDPSNLSFPNGYQGCPSLLLSGGPTVVLDGSVQIDSNCSSTNGGALSTNGNAAIVQMNNGSVIRMVGGYSPGPLTISPTPMTGQKYVSDPLAGLPAVPVSSLPVQSTSRLTLSGSTTVLSPGVYTGGILMKNQAVALLQPGIYVMNGGGFAMGAQNAVYSVAQGVTTTTDSTWNTTDCLDTNCGILLYNTGTASGSGAMNQISVGAGATLRLKPYLPSADMNNASGGATYRDTALAFQNLLFWQNANPVPTPSYSQPVLQLNGGGSVTMSGGVYAPSAITQMGGGSGGSGGTPTNLTIQFITWDLVLQGNSSFHFYYQSQDFPKPMDYGLIK